MNEKPIIIALVGPSGSGKTTLSLYMQEKCDIPAICSYTTRPIRSGEVNGREHWFVDFSHPIPEKPLAYTFFGGHHYWTSPEQVTNNGHKYCTYVIDEKGLLELKDKWSDQFEILSVYIDRPYTGDIDAKRAKRDVERINLDVDNYDIILYNDKDLKSFLTTAITTIATFIY